MLKNHFAIALRNFWKRPVFALIHIVGLSLGLLASLFIFLFVRFHFITNTFPDADRIYRVVLDMHVTDGSIAHEPGTSLPMARALQDEYAAVEQTSFYMPFYQSPQLTLPTPTGELRRFIEHDGVAYADAHFLPMFGYHFVQGDPTAALTLPNQAVITQRQARKYFGKEDALGKTIRINNQADLIVSGVVASPSPNTDFTTNLWVSLPTLRVLKPSYQTENFTWIGSNNWTFVKLSKNNPASVIDQQLPDFVGKYLGDQFAHWHFHLQPLHDLHFDTRYGGTIRKPLLHLLSIVALFIVLIACINFVNLSTAAALSRAKEVGVRKALGSTREQLFWQFITETALIVMVAVALVALGAAVGLPWLNNWIHTQLSLQALVTPAVGISIFVFILGIILLAGSYPALVLARFHPIRALHNQISAKEVGANRLRQWLVTLQFAIAQAFILGAVVVLYQLDYFQQRELGFRQEAIVTVKVFRSDYSRLETFRNQLKQRAEIKHVSFHQSPPIADSNEGDYVRFNRREEREPFLVRYRWADEDYLATYDLHLVAGRNMHLRDSVTEFLVNEEFVKALGASSEEEVLGKPLHEGNTGAQGVIVGVVEDFHHRSLQNPIEPLLIYPCSYLFTQAGIQLQSNDLSQTLQTIQSVWEETFPDHVFAYQFLEDSVAQFYEKEQRIGKLIRIFTFVAIAICCLGLIGLAMHAAQRRTKEIGIRKVLGATVANILLLLSREFIGMVLIGFLLSAPIAYYLLQDWLNSFAYRISIDWWMFALSWLGVTLLSLLMIGGHVLKATYSNPVDSLRDE